MPASDEALSGVAPDAEGVPLATLRDVVLAVQERRIERALVPIENALEGGVDPVLDCLALEAADVSLVGEVVQPVSYCLAAGRVIAFFEGRGQLDRLDAADADSARACLGRAKERLSAASGLFPMKAYSTRSSLW